MGGFQPLESNCVRLPVGHHIETTDALVHFWPRRLAEEKLRVARKEFEHILELGIIRPSSSSWPPKYNYKKKKKKTRTHTHKNNNNGDWRFCGDYRALNKNTVPDHYTLSNIQDFNVNLEGATIFFPKVDRTLAYHHISDADEDLPKTAITAPFCLFEFLGMHFGLRNAAQTFQRFIDAVTRGLPFVFAYVDDLILVASSTPEEHTNHLRLLFETCRQRHYHQRRKKWVWRNGAQLPWTPTEPRQHRTFAVRSAGGQGLSKAHVDHKAP